MVIKNLNHIERSTRYCAYGPQGFPLLTQEGNRNSLHGFHIHTGLSIGLHHHVLLFQSAVNEFRIRQHGKTQTLLQGVLLVEGVDGDHVVYILRHHVGELRHIANYICHFRVSDQLFHVIRQFLQFLGTVKRPVTIQFAGITGVVVDIGAAFQTAHGYGSFRRCRTLRRGFYCTCNGGFRRRSTAAGQQHCQNQE